MVMIIYNANTLNCQCICFSVYVPPLIATSNTDQKNTWNTDTHTYTRNGGMDASVRGGRARKWKTVHYYYYIISVVVVIIIIVVLITNYSGLIEFTFTQWP